MLRADGILWECGGNGYAFPKYVPFENDKRTKFVRGLTDVATMATTWDRWDSSASSMAVKKDGTVWVKEKGATKWTQVFHD